MKTSLDTFPFAMLMLMLMLLLLLLLVVVVVVVVVVSNVWDDSKRIPYVNGGSPC